LSIFKGAQAVLNSLNLPLKVPKRIGTISPTFKVPQATCIYYGNRSNITKVGFDFFHRMKMSIQKCMGKLKDDFGGTAIGRY
jgi:hypothetical protein